MNERKYHIIGRSTHRKDGIAKVSGHEKYTSDINPPNMLYGMVLRSPYPHARVKSIDTSDAEKAGAVCITFRDTPKLVYCERISSVPSQTINDKTVLTDKPLHVGDRIAAVAAETEEEAERALKLIKVEYEVLKPIFDPMKSMQPGEPKLHEFTMMGEEKKLVENNISARFERSSVDFEKGFEESDVILEREYSFCRPYHSQLETKVAVCQPEADGGITLWNTTQTIHNVRILIGRIFGIPLGKINVKKLSIGGSFGSSIHVNSIVPICVALALKSKRPVKLVQSREDDMYDHCTYPYLIKFKLGAKKDGKIVAGKMEVLIDVGAYNTQALVLLRVNIKQWLGHYKLPNYKFDGKAVYTNKVPACAMVGFGVPQINFPIEVMMDELAEELGMDPIELRLKNYVGLGESFGVTPTVREVVTSCGLEEILKKGADLIGWANRSKPGEQKGEIMRGIGMARCYNVSGTGAPMPIGGIEVSGALIKINEDGTVDLVSALMDQGGGTLEAMAKIVAEELGVPLDNVNLSPTDTRTATYDVCTHAQRGTFAGGLTVKKVAGQVREKLLETASRVLGAYPHALRIRPDEKIGQGVIYSEGVVGKEITIAEVAEIARQNNWGTIAAVDNYAPPSCAPAFSAYFIEVEVNSRTGKVNPTRVVIGADAGTIINPELAAGQLHGGLNKGMSWALLEDTLYNEKTGELMSKGFLTDYKMLTSMEMPVLEDTKLFFTETFDPTGPFGAKGVGEIAVNPVASAVANAVYNATGIGFREIPITPEKVLTALREREERRS